MYLRISREDFSWSRSRKAIPVFGLLWSGVLVLALVTVFALRSHLQSIEMSEANQLLTSYLNIHRIFSRSYGPLRFNQENLHEDLIFVRVKQGGDQTLVVGSQAGATGFKEILGLGPEQSGVWLPVDTADGRRVITVITKKYDHGVLVQAGKDGSRGYQLYLKLLRYTAIIVFGSIVLLWPLSLYFIKLSLDPLVTTRKRIRELGKSRGGFLPEHGNGPELDRLYVQINKLIRQNRHLVAEMQQSLDNVAHDLRTPMTRLRSVAEYGLQGDEQAPRLREALSDCLEESERVLAMLRIMMSVAEAESGTMRLEKVDTDLVSLLQQVVVLYEYVAEEKKISVELQTETPVRLKVDPTRISQVWANLLDNAIKYGREGGWVKIIAGTAGDEAFVVFSDNGIGISPVEQGRIWERLYRGDRSRSQKGLGLGLNYVRAVIEAHDGRVSVESRLHQGSRFEVALPLAQEAIQDTIDV